MNRRIRAAILEHVVEESRVSEQYTRAESEQQQSEPEGESPQRPAKSAPLAQRRQKRRGRQGERGQRGQDVHVALASAETEEQHDQQAPRFTQ